MCDTIQDFNILKCYMRILKKKSIWDSIDLAFQLYSMFPNTVIKF